MTTNKIVMDIIKASELESTLRLNMLRKSGAMLYEVISGSKAYGTNLPTSDEDRRGIFMLPIEEYLKTTEPVLQISDDRKNVDKPKNDDVFYTLHRFFQLLKSSNPNIIELLWIPQNCIVHSSPEMDRVIKNRDKFISKACLASHFGYAQAQIAKATGQNKKVNNPCPKTPPNKADFCYVMNFHRCQHHTEPLEIFEKHPFRPIPIKDYPSLNLNHYHAAAVEHVANTYRLYYYGDKAKGVFRGDGMLTCESVPEEDEKTRFSGILVFKKEVYEKALKEWNSYWDWMKNRNVARWIKQKQGKINYDHKNMMHCVRLLLSGINILKNGEPLVRFSGKEQQYLMDIRLGNTTQYETILKKVDELVAEMRAAEKTSTIPEKVDAVFMDEFYQDVSKAAWKRIFETNFT